MDRILVNCPLNPAGFRVLEEAGFETIHTTEPDFEASYRHAPEIVGLVANAILPIDDRFCALAPKLRVVGRLGVGYDNVDARALERRGVALTNTPEEIVEPVAEHAFALLLALTRQIVPGHASMRAGTFRDGDRLPGFELRGKTLGVLGLGNTGARVADIGKLGFGMDIVYSDPRARPDVEERLGARRLALEDFPSACDVVSVHAALSDATRGLVGREFLGRMKAGSLLLNLSRGPVVDEKALEEALDSGPLAAAGLDVYAVEPPPGDHPLFQRDDVVLSAHRAGFSSESVVNMATTVTRDVVAVLRGEEPRFRVV